MGEGARKRSKIPEANKGKRPAKNLKVSIYSFEIIFAIWIRMLSR